MPSKSHGKYTVSRETPENGKSVPRTPSMIEAESLRQELNEVVSSIECALIKSKSPEPRPSSPALSHHYYSNDDSESLSSLPVQTTEPNPTSSMATSTHPGPLIPKEELEEAELSRNEVVRLRLRVQQLETGLARVKSTAQGFKEERDRLKRKLREVQSLKLQQQVHGSTLMKGKDVGNSPSISPVSATSLPTNQSIHIKVPLSEPKISDLLDISTSPVPPIVEMDQKVSTAVERVKKAKLAEKVRLKRCSDAPEDGSVRGSEISSLGVKSSAVAEHLVSDLYEESGIQESLHGSSSSVDKERRCEVEFERLKAQSAHLQSQITLLEQSLGESRSCSDYLSSLCAQLEANQTALHLALDYSAQGDDLCSALIEFLLLLRRPSTENNDVSLPATKDSSISIPDSGRDTVTDEDNLSTRRAQLEQSLRLLIHKTESCLGGTSDDSFPHFQEGLFENHDESMSSSGALSASTGLSCDSSFEELNSALSFSKSLLRPGNGRGQWNQQFLIQKTVEQIGRLKRAKSCVLETVQSLDALYSHSPGLLCPPPFAHFGVSTAGSRISSAGPHIRHKSPNSDQQGGRLMSNQTSIETEKIDLENAVLIQELAALKEEKADLKATIYLLERDKEGLNLTLRGKLSELEATRLHLDQLKADCFQDGKEIKYSQEDLRARVLDMADALQTVTENADLRQKQSEQFIMDLRHANDALLCAFDRSRKKHHSRLERMQEQMRVMQSRYEAQLQILRQQRTPKKEKEQTDKRFAVSDSAAALT